MATKSKPKQFTRFIKFLWWSFFSGITLLAILLALISFGAFGTLPTFKQLENPESFVASEIYSYDLQVIGKYYDQNRTPVKYEELSPHLVTALVATEDVRFYEHSGIDLKGIVAVVPYMLIGKRRGSSTISQQLAKNLFPRAELNKFELVIRKMKEWVIATKLERNYTKEEIITMYMNTVTFSQQTYGIKSAARTYFNKFPIDLDMHEAATLVGILKANTKYDPKRNPENSRNRRNTVLSQMCKYGYITETEKDSVQAIDLVLDYQSQSHNMGLATYFREMLRTDPKIKDLINTTLRPDGTPYDLYRDGLKIYTTLDSRMQRHAEDAADAHLKELQATFWDEWDKYGNWKKHQKTINRAVRQSDRYRQMKANGKTDKEINAAFSKISNMKMFTWKVDEKERKVNMSPLDSIRYLKRILHTGFMSMDPSNGHIRVWVGGIDHRYFKYDHVRQSRRQVGSTFKPIVYATALKEDVATVSSICKEIPNIEYCIEDDIGRNWCPKNSGKTHDGLVLSYKLGLANSINRMTAYVMKEIKDPQTVVQFGTEELGLKNLEPVPSICLGVCDLSVYEMVGAYGAFANQGTYNEPIYLLRIEDKYGNVLRDFSKQQEVHQAMKEDAAYTIVSLLQGVVDGVYCEHHRRREGTGMRLKRNYKLTGPMGGKTGTTQNNSDGWFMNITPQLVSGAWVGCHDREFSFRRTKYGQGAHMALPIVGKYLEKVYNDERLEYSPTIQFKKPKNYTELNLDCKQEADPDDY